MAKDWEGFISSNMTNSTSDLGGTTVSTTSVAGKVNSLGTNYKERFHPKTVRVSRFNKEYEMVDFININEDDFEVMQIYTTQNQHFHTLYHLMYKVIHKDEKVMI